jgi:hypothetical protein
LDRLEAELEAASQVAHMLLPDLGDKVKRKRAKK